MFAHIASLSLSDFARPATHTVPGDDTRTPTQLGHGMTQTWASGWTANYNSASESKLSSQCNKVSVAPVRAG